MPKGADVSQKRVAKSHASATRSHLRLKIKRDKRVLKSSHGLYKTVAAIEEHRKSLEGKNNHE